MPQYRKFNDGFFKHWSSNMAYILGFLFADGNIIITKRNTHFVALYTADEGLLLSIRKLLLSDHKISSRKSKTGCVYRIQIGSKTLFNDLVMLGLTPNKSRRMELPKIPIKYVGDFVRGYFDGDGNVWKGEINKKRKNPSIALGVAFTSASKNFLHNLFIILKNAGVKGGCLHNIKSKNCTRLQYSTLDSLKLYEIMYNRPHELYLHRKKLIFEEFIKMRP